MSDVAAAELAQDERNFRIYKYAIIATCAFLIYDYILTFEEEIRLVWKARWSFVKVLFLSARLFAFLTVAVDVYMLFGNNSDESCQALIQTMGELISAVFCIGEAMLFLRVFAIWRESKLVLAFLTILLLAGFAGFFYVASRDASHVVAISDASLFGAGCLLQDHTGDFFICHVILLVDETVMISLILLKASLMTRHEGGNFLSRGYQLVVKDGIGYFVIVSLLSLVSILIARLAPQALRLFHIGLHAALASILSCRLLLRLRVAYSGPELTAGHTSTMSDWIARSTTLQAPLTESIFSPLSYLHDRSGRSNAIETGTWFSPKTEAVELDTVAKLGRDCGYECSDRV